MVEAESARIGEVFTLPGRIKRGDKSDYPSYQDPAVKKIDAELMGYAQSSPKNCTLTEKVRWRQALAAIAATSFWSGEPEVRALVKELDLDPMADEHAGALWTARKHVYVTRAKLRACAIRLWNNGAAFLYIQDMEGPDTCWSDYKSSAPTGFLITYAFRRKLPLPPAP